MMYSLRTENKLWTQETAYTGMKFKLSYNYTMRFIGYDSIQTRLFISYRFQIHTIT